MKIRLGLLVTVVMLSAANAQDTQSDRIARKEAMRRRPTAGPDELAVAKRQAIEKRESRWDGTARREVESERAIHDLSPKSRAELGFNPATRSKMRGLTVDVGQIAVLENDGTIVTDVPTFDLDGTGLRFTPNGSGYDTAVIPLVLDTDLGTNLSLGDDASAEVAFTSGFTFSFYARPQTSVFANSNGNLTFGQGDVTFSEFVTLLGSSVPRIAPLFRDFSPFGTANVFTNQMPDRLTLTWNGVPEFFTSNSNTFQVVLFSNGVIEFHYDGVDARSGKVGLFPGAVTQAVDLSSFSSPMSFTGGVYENFAAGADLEGFGVEFTPDGPGGYTIHTGAVSFDAALGSPLFLGDDDSILITFLDGFSFPFFGVPVDSLFVNSNGTATPSLMDPFPVLNPAQALEVFLFFGGRLSPFFTDLDPSSGGGVFIKQLSDRIVVTWNNIPGVAGGNSNTFQLTCFDTGVIRFDYSNIETTEGLAGFVRDIPSVGADWSAGAPASFNDVACEFFGIAPFDLNGSRLTFTPNGAAYDVALGSAMFDSNFGSSLSLGDEDSELVSFTGEFTFPFYGAARSGVYVNSNGNLTFNAPDPDTFAPTLSDFLSSTPRIAPMFEDLDPSTSGGVFARQEADRVVISYLSVAQFAAPAAVTMQVTLFDSGVIVFDYPAAFVDYLFTFSPPTIITGISPGDPQAEINVVDFTMDPPLTAVPSVIAEIFPLGRQVDIFRVGEVFYQTHADNFDFLVLFTNFPSDLGGAFAFELNVSNAIAGIGLTPNFDFSGFFGSDGELESFLNMNFLDLYPDDLNQPFLGDNSALSIMGQEAGHRWLAFTDVSLAGQPLLGRQTAHWSFFMDSEASVMEGNDWMEGPTGTFTSVDTVSRFSTLDQYLMGLRGPATVNPFFVIGNPSGPFNPASGPNLGTVLTGTRIGGTINDIIAVAGARSPAFPAAPSTVTAAFVLLTLAGNAPTAAELAKVEAFRSQWSEYYRQATDARGTFMSNLGATNQVAPGGWRSYE